MFRFVGAANRDAQTIAVAPMPPAATLTRFFTAVGSSTKPENDQEKP
jgi:hypothetical protein